MCSVRNCQTTACTRVGATSSGLVQTREIVLVRNGAVNSVVLVFLIISFAENYVRRCLVSDHAFHF